MVRVGSLPDGMRARKPVVLRISVLAMLDGERSVFARVWVKVLDRLGPRTCVWSVAFSGSMMWWKKNIGSVELNFVSNSRGDWGLGEDDALCC